MVFGSSEKRPTTIMKLRADFATVRPCCCTSWGSSAVAVCSLFWTWTWAMSISVPALKVRVIVAAPELSLVDDMYSRPSRPFIFCSMTWVTLSSTVLADAPG